MKTEHFELELLTRCFLGGANPLTTAELRASSIRGQLRWWFRTLGGFNAPASSNLRQQEDEIFGMAADGSGTAGMLRVQILRTASVTQEVIGLGLGRVQVPVGEKYFLWPFEQDPMKPRACLATGTKFQLRVHWRGNPALWPSIRALVTVFGQLGSLGTRSRRAMGALTFANAPPNLSTALAHFSSPTSITVRQLNSVGHTTVQAAVAALAEWLKQWRGYTVSIRARQDHDLGAGLALATQPAYRAALGLPIGQRFNGGRTVKWEFGRRPNKGRFASPVILRPYRVAAQQWRALVIFVDAHEWPDDTMRLSPATGQPMPRQVYLDDIAHDVSRDLYAEMKRLTPTPFP
jgi:CRISPR/Cas system CMR-associated protein Cmr1 (group 7 of RAMP superfamily)